MEGFTLEGLVGGVLGAFAIFVVTSLYGLAIGLRQRARERVGLLRLVGAEIEYNAAAASVTMDAWKDCRITLAQRLSGERFKVLVEYYKGVQQVGAVDTRPSIDEEEARKALAIVKEYAEGGFTKRHFGL